MTYRAGTGGLGGIGIPDGEPRIVCDGCGVTKSVTKSSGMAASWFLSGRPAPGWKLERADLGDGSVSRVDLCPRCRP